MDFVKQKAEVINNYTDFSVLTKVQNISNVARICYKSENNSSPEKNYKLVENLIKNKHYGMLEHEDYIFYVVDSYLYYYKSAIKNMEYYYGIKDYLVICGNIISGNIRAWRNFYKLLFMFFDNVAKNDSKNFPWIIGFPIPEVFRNNIFFDDVFEKNLDKISSQGSYNAYVNFWWVSNADAFNLVNKNDLTDKMSVLSHYRISSKIVCDRGISHELVRHRTFSFAQESTRYVNYQNRGIQFIDYSDFDLKPSKSKKHISLGLINNASEYAKDIYDKLMQKGNAPQMARAVLTHNLKTEIIMTGTVRSWLHFFNLRYFEKTGKAHPLIKDISCQLYNDFELKTPISRKLINEWSEEMWDSINE